MTEKTILEVNSIDKKFTRASGIFGKPSPAAKSVDGISFSLKKGEVLGIAGESGSGKTTLAKIICGLMDFNSGSVIIDGKDISDYGKKELAGKIQMIFQDPFSSLNPKLSVGTVITEAVQAAVEKRNLAREPVDILRMVGLPENVLKQYPHQLSGGQRQRVAIARALAVEPEIIIADEPVSSLDISVQAQIMNLFFELKEKAALSYIIISHDLNLLGIAADNIIVMKNGKEVEYGPSAGILKNPRDAYTKKLIASIPEMYGKN